MKTATTTDASILVPEKIEMKYKKSKFGYRKISSRLFKVRTKLKLIQTLKIGLMTNVAK